MKNRRFALTLAALFCVAGFRAGAQNSAAGPGAPVRVPPKADVTERTGRVVAAPALPAAPPLDPAGLGPNERPARPERPDLPPEIKGKIERFERLRENYLKEQQDLLKKLKTAGDVDRDKIREQIKSSREDWLEKVRNLREEARERKQELMERLPRHRELIDDAKEKARDRAREGRPRRGRS